MPRESDNQADFADWVERHRGILVKTVRAFAQPADQDDLMQETLLNLWRALPSFRGDSLDSTFVYRIAHNTALTWQRRTIGRRNRLTLFSREAVAAPELGPSDALIERLYEAIRSLPEADRSLIMLHLDELSYRDIAGVTGLTETNIGARLTRIRSKLATLMKGPHNDL